MFLSLSLQRHMVMPYCLFDTRHNQATILERCAVNGSGTHRTLIIISLSNSFWICGLQGTRSIFLDYLGEKLDLRGSSD
jgi:hypothetical protein